MHQPSQKIASISLDLDNQWAYMRSSNIAGWEDHPSYLDIAVPRSIDLFNQHNTSITYFIVGQDAALEKNHNALMQIADAGHEIGNHSFNHEPWLHLYNRDELVDEIKKAEESIESATGIRPIGFRAPGFSVSPAVLDVLAERGYLYDCSTFPTYIGPLARAFYFLKSEEMSDEERNKRKQLFGKISDGFQTLHPYVMNVSGNDLVEIPVTTFPIIKIPIHVSYLMYLASFSNFAAKKYWQTALFFCGLTGTAPSLLFHPLDFLGGDEIPELKFFPGMSLTSETKTNFLNNMIDSLTSKFSILTLARQAENVLQARNSSI